MLIITTDGENEYMNQANVPQNYNEKHNIISGIYHVCCFFSHLMNFIHRYIS